MKSHLKMSNNEIAGRSIVLTTHVLRNYARRILHYIDRDAIAYVSKNRAELKQKLTSLLESARPLTKVERDEFGRKHVLKTKGTFLLSDGKTVFVCESHPFHVVCSTCYPLTYLNKYNYNEKSVRQNRAADKWAALKSSVKHV